VKNPQSEHSTLPSSRLSWALQRGQYFQPSSSDTVGNNSQVHDQPKPTPEEHEQAPERQDEAEEQRGPAPADPVPGEELDDA
jgi:hypothetical protein